MWDQELQPAGDTRSCCDVQTLSWSGPGPTKGQLLSIISVLARKALIVTREIPRLSGALCQEHSSQMERVSFTVQQLERITEQQECVHNTHTNLGRSQD